jgi:hypothetical protein
VNPSLFGDLAKIPHLRIGQVQADELQAIVHEIQSQVADYAPVEINSAIAGPQSDEFAQVWMARGIIDHHPDSRTILTYQRVRQLQALNPGDVVPYHRTDLYEKLPSTVRLVERISRKPRTTRIFSLRPQSALPWHTHYQGAYTPNEYRRVVIQIPLWNSELSSYEVRMPGTDSIARQIYLPGEIWIFNCFHEHRVTNASDSERVSLFIDTDVNDIRDCFGLNQTVQNHLQHATSELAFSKAY